MGREDRSGVDSRQSGPSPSAWRSIRRSERSSDRWSRTLVNFWVDCLLGVLFLGLAWVSAALRLLFPVGPAERNWQVWGAGVEFWRDVQFLLLCAFSLTVLLHVMLHWSWVCGVVAKHLLGRAPRHDDGSQTLIGVGLLIGILHLLGAALVLAWLSAGESTTPPPDLRSNVPTGAGVRKSAEPSAAAGNDPTHEGPRAHSMAADDSAGADWPLAHERRLSARIAHAGGVPLVTRAGRSSSSGFGAKALRESARRS